MSKPLAILKLFSFAIFSFITVSAQNSLPVQVDSSIHFSNSTSSTRSVAKSKNYLSPKSMAIPAVFICYGFTSLGHNSIHQINQNVSHEVTEDMPGFRTTADDYLKYAPAVSVYALNIAGVKGKHKLIPRTAVYLVSNVLTNQIVTSLKHATHQLRPDGSTYNSFPSGHTATAFAGAEFMNQELGWHSRWYSIAGYTLAGTTGALRIANNRHWLGDVIAGAGIGILTTKFTYWVYNKVERKMQSKKPVIY